MERWINKAIQSILQGDLKHLARYKKTPTP